MILIKIICIAWLWIVFGEVFYRNSGNQLKDEAFIFACVNSTITLIAIYILFKTL
jgi:hypothetical protein